MMFTDEGGLLLARFLALRIWFLIIAAPQGALRFGDSPNPIRVHPRLT
jgi:hypothetical protein